MTNNHQNSVLCGKKPKYDLVCINCLAAGMTHSHKATDWLCPFYIERNNKKNITSLLATIRMCCLEGFENPFGLTKVRHSPASSSYDSSTAARKHTSRMGNYPTQFLAEAAIVMGDDSGSSLRLASSNESLFRHVPNITASQVAAASASNIQDFAPSL